MTNDVDDKSEPVAEIRIVGPADDRYPWTILTDRPLPERVLMRCTGVEDANRMGRHYATWVTDDLGGWARFIDAAGVHHRVENPLGDDSDDQRARWLALRLARYMNGVLNGNSFAGPVIRDPLYVELLTLVGDDVSMAQNLIEVELREMNR